jgi:hypothetical protein
MEYNFSGHYLKLLNGKLVCSDCPAESNTNTDNEWHYRDISEDADNSGTYEYDQARRKQNKNLQDSAQIKIDSSEIVLDSLSN